MYFVDDFNVLKPIIHLMSRIVVYVLETNGIHVLLMLFDSTAKRFYGLSDIFGSTFLVLDLLHDHNFSSVLITLSLNGNTSPDVFGALRAALKSTCV
jgi:hypothetical protein